MRPHFQVCRKLAFNQYDQFTPNTSSFFGGKYNFTKFSAEVAANDPDSIKKLNDCCYEWIQSVEKVLKDITKDPKAEKKKENKKDELLKSAKEEELKTKPFVVGKTDNEVLKEIEMWEERLRRFEGLEAQLKMNAVERSLMILHTAGNVHAKTLTDYIEEIKNLHEEAQDNVK